MKLLYTDGSLEALTYRPDNDKRERVGKGDEVPGLRDNPSESVYLTPTPTLTSNGGEFGVLLSIAFSPRIHAFEIVVDESTPPSFAPEIHTRGNRGLFTVTRQGQTGNHDRYLYSGERLRVQWESSWTVEFSAVDDDDLADDSTPEKSEDPLKLYSPSFNNRYLDGAKVDLGAYDQVGKYLFYSIYTIDKSGTRIETIAKQPQVRRDESGDSFRERALDFRDRVRGCKAAQEYLGVHSSLYPEILDAEGGGESYREPFVLMRKVASSDDHDVSLRAFVKNTPSRLPDAQGSATMQTKGLPYRQAWAILTQVAHVAKAFRERGKGHGQLTPENILVHAAEDGRQVRITVCSFGCKSSDSVSDGFFVSDPDETERHDWILRDRFALGSLMYYMLSGDPPPPLVRAEMKTGDWIKERLSKIREKDREGASIEDLERFMKSCWNPGAEDPLSLLNHRNMFPLPIQATELSEKPQLKQRVSVLWPWMLLLGLVILSFWAVHAQAFQALLDNRPWVKEANNLLSYLTPTPEPTVMVSATSSPTSLPVLIQTSTPGYLPASIATRTATPTFFATLTHTATLRPMTPTRAATLRPSRTPSPFPTATAPLDARLPPLGRCGPGLELSQPLPWKEIDKDLEITGTVNRDLNADVIDNDPPPLFARYDISVFQMLGDQLLEYQIPDKDIESRHSPHDESRLGWLRRDSLKRLGFQSGHAVLRLRVIFQDGNYNDCALPIQLKM